MKTIAVLIILVFVPLAYAQDQCSECEDDNLLVSSNTMMIGGGVEAAAPGGATIDDDFSSDTSADYGTIDRGINITGGVAEGNGTVWQSSAVYHDTDLGDDNIYVEAVVEWTALSNDICGLLINIVPGATPDSTAAGYVVWYDDNDASLREFTGGDAANTSWVDTQTYTGSETWTTGDRHLMKVYNDGSGNIDVDIDWNDDLDFGDSNESPAASFPTDTTYTGGYVGIYWYNNGTQNYVDDLKGDTN